MRYDETAYFSVTLILSDKQESDERSWLCTIKGETKKVLAKTVKFMVSGTLMDALNSFLPGECTGVAISRA